MSVTDIVTDVELRHTLTSLGIAAIATAKREGIIDANAEWDVPVVAHAIASYVRVAPEIERDRVVAFAAFQLARRYAPGEMAA